VRTPAPSRVRADDSERAPVLGLGWRPVTLLILSLFGLGDSIYLTLAHYSASVVVACADTGGIDCSKVITSPQSIIFGIPVAVYGLAYYVVTAVASLPFAWRRTTPRLLQLRLASATVGLGFVAYLLYTELYTIRAICLWCTGVHIVTFVIFVILVTGWDDLVGLSEQYSADSVDEVS
jgi:uncharacterized membrane protein